MTRSPARHAYGIALTLAVLAACGSSHDTVPDAAAPGDAPSPIDAAADAVPSDAPARVRVTVLSDAGDGQPDTTANVIFVDAGNALVKQGLVGAAGTSEADLPRGGIVHVLRELDTSPNDIRASIVSIRVQPGDDITFGVAASAPQGAEVRLQGTYTPLTGIVSFYGFTHPCGSGFGDPAEGNIARLISVAGCLPATFDVLATTVDSIGHVLVPPRYVWFSATPAGGFAAPALQEMPAFTAHLGHVPVGSSVEIQRATLLSPYFRDAASSAAQISATATTVTAGLFYPPAAAAFGVVEARVRPAASDAQLQLVRTRIGGAVATIDLDLDAVALPVIETAPMLSGKVVSWTQTGTGTPDLREVTASSTHHAGSWNYTVDWTVIDDATDSFVELPGLPAMFAEVDPTQQLVSHPTGARVVYVDYSNVAGYAAARHLALGSLTGHGQLPRGEGLFDDQLYSMRASIY